MTPPIKFVLMLLLTAPLLFGQNAQNRQEQLFADLQRESTTVTAASQLESLGISDPSVRAYLATHLPPLLETRSNITVWKSEVVLAGNMKLVEAVPALTRLLTVNSEDGGLHTIYKSMELLNDAPARALVAIGDPAVEDVAKLLDNADNKTRSRAVRVLIKINSQASKDALKRHEPNEADPGLQRLIAKHLQ
jgi:hypothetical protein